MIIILISVAAVTGWSFALMQNSKASKASLSVIEQEAIAAALRNHVNSLEESVTEKVLEIKSLKSTLQSLNDKAKAKATPKMVETKSTAVKTDAKLITKKPVSKKKSN